MGEGGPGRGDSSDCRGPAYFQKTASDKEWDKRCEDEGFVGHPPYAEWFCEKHFLIAKKYSALPKRVALVSIKRELKKKGLERK